jgi:hypothetical protein
MISREDANDALELAEALLDYIYVFSDRFEKFKMRRVVESSKDSSRVPSTPEGLDPR